MFRHSLFLTENDDYSEKVSTSLLVRESARRGLPTFVFSPDEIVYTNNAAYALGHKAHFKKDKFVIEKTTRKIVLDDNNLIHLRLDPPFDNRYLTMMHIFATLKKPVIVNNPTGIILLPEKILGGGLQKFMPPTLFSRNVKEITTFFKKYGKVVVKPIFEFGGNNVHKAENLKDLEKVVGTMLKQYREPLIIQKFLTNISKGDKRINLIDGKFSSCFLRVPKKGNFLSAIEHGYGVPVASELTKREKEICKVLGPILKKNGIFMCGIDVIDGYLTEVNVTNPASFSALNRIYGSGSEKIYWDRLEQKLKKH